MRRSAPDTDLVVRVLRADDRAAFAELVGRHQGAVRGLLRRLTTGDLARADDLAQETFIKAYLKLATFRGEAGLATWLYRIAVNSYLADQRRAARREQPGGSDPQASGRVEATELQPRPADRTALQVDLERAMASLSDIERTAIALCYATGLSHAEAAEVLGIPVGTIKTHILRGKQKLKPRLAAWETKPDERTG